MPATDEAVPPPPTPPHQPLTTFFLIEFIHALICTRRVGERIEPPRRDAAAFDTCTASFTIDNSVGNFELACSVIARLDEILDAHPTRHATACNVIQLGTCVTFTLTLRTRT